MTCHAAENEREWNNKEIDYKGCRPDRHHGGGDRGLQGGTQFSAECGADQFLADYVYTVFRMENCSGSAGFYLDRGMYLRIWALVGDVSVCMAAFGISGVFFSKAGIGVVLEYFFRVFWAVLWAVMRRPLCGDRRSGRGNRKRALCGFYLVGSRNSLGYRALHRKFCIDENIVQADSHSHEKSRGILNH